MLVLYQCFSITFGFTSQEKVSFLHISPWETMSQVFQSWQYNFFFLLSILIKSLFYKLVELENQMRRWFLKYKGFRLSNRNINIYCASYFEWKIRGYIVSCHWLSYPWCPTGSLLQLTFFYKCSFNQFFLIKKKLREKLIVNLKEVKWEKSLQNPFYFQGCIWSLYVLKTKMYFIWKCSFCLQDDIVMLGNKSVFQNSRRSSNDKQQ